MRKHTRTLMILLELALTLLPLAGCGSGQNEGSGQDGSGDAGEGAPAAFSNSDGIDDNGYWESITALDHVELYDYQTMTIPSTVYAISDEAVDNEVSGILSGYTTRQVLDRAVEDGDTVNIDYVGSVEGVEFAGGSTGGNGTDVTIGVTSYIDDFLEQLIGHMPGETIDVAVTFPEDYGVEELNGQDALFITTINYIAQTVDPELNDDFVAENLLADRGWSTVEEMREGISSELQRSAILGYTQQYLMDNATVLSLPDELLAYTENAMLSFYRDGADYYGVALEEFLSGYEGVSSVEELIERYRENNVEQAQYYLVVQAVAEDAGITAGDADVAAFFSDNMGGADFAQFEAQYGMPYLKQAALSQLVLEHLASHAALE